MSQLKTSQIFMMAAALSGFISVALGAFAAHGLAAIATEARIAIFATGAEYQMTHSLALLAVSMLLNRPNNSVNTSFWALKISGWAFILGITLFSGSLYLLVLLDLPMLGAITPLGGLAFLIGWLGLFIYALKTVK